MWVRAESVDTKDVTVYRAFVHARQVGGMGWYV